MVYDAGDMAIMEDTGNDQIEAKAEANKGSDGLVTTRISLQIRVKMEDVPCPALPLPVTPSMAKEIERTREGQETDSR